MSPSGNVIVALLSSVDSPLNGISTVVDDEYYHVEIHLDDSSDFLHIHLETAVSNKKIRTRLVISDLLGTGKCRSKSCW